MTGSRNRPASAQLHPTSPIMKLRRDNSGLLECAYFGQSSGLYISSYSRCRLISASMAQFYSTAQEGVCMLPTYFRTRSTYFASLGISSASYLCLFYALRRIELFSFDSLSSLAFLEKRNKLVGVRGMVDRHRGRALDINLNIDKINRMTQGHQQQRMQTAKEEKNREVTLENIRSKHYTFSFKQYNAEHLRRHQHNYLRNLKVRTKMFLGLSVVVLALGSIYPLMMYIEYDINIYKPRVSEYILNRLD